MSEENNLHKITWEAVANAKGHISYDNLYAKFKAECDKLHYDEYKYINQIARPAIEDYEKRKATLIEKVSARLNAATEPPENYVLYNEFINECNALGLDEKSFNSEIVAKASNQIDWSKSLIPKPITQKKTNLVKGKRTYKKQPAQNSLNFVNHNDQVIRNKWGSKITFIWNWLVIFILAFFLFIIFCKHFNPYIPKSFQKSPIDYYILSCCVFILPRLFHLPHIRHFRTAPQFMRYTGFILTGSVTLISIFLGFHTDMLTSYDNTNSKKSSYWFHPSHIIKFPLQQMNINKGFSELTYLPQKLNIDTSNKWDEENNKTPILFINLIDRTSSAKENDKFKILSTQFQNSDKKNNRRDSISLRDYLGANIINYVSPNYSKNCNVITILYDGRNSSKVLKNLTVSTTSGDIDINENSYRNFLDTCREMDSADKQNMHSGDTAKTDFFNFICFASDTLKKILNAKKSYNTCISIISDFYHETDYKGYHSIYEINDPVGKFSLNPLFKKGELYLNLYRLPLFNPTQEKEENIDGLIKIFQSSFELNFIHNYPLKTLLEIRKYPDPSLSFLPVTEKKNTPVKFYYKNSDKVTNCSLLLKLPPADSTDTLKVAVINENNDEITPSNYVPIFYSGADSGEIEGYENIPEPFYVRRDTFSLKIKTHKKHIPGSSHGMFLEVFSSKNKSITWTPIEFCPVIPESNNFFFLFLNYSFFLSFMLYCALPRHFLFVKRRISNKTLKPKHIWLSVFLLFAFILFGVFFFFYTVYDNGIIDLWINIFLAVFGILIIIPTIFKYRFYLSKSLFYKNSDTKNGYTKEEDKKEYADWAGKLKGILIKDEKLFDEVN